MYALDIASTSICMENTVKFKDVTRFSFTSLNYLAILHLCKCRAQLNLIHRHHRALSGQAETNLTLMH